MVKYTSNYVILTKKRAYWYTVSLANIFFFANKEGKQQKI